MGTKTAAHRINWARPVVGATLAGAALLAIAAPARAALVLPPPSLKVTVGTGLNAPTILTSNGPGTLIENAASNNATASASIQISPGVLLSSSVMSDPVFASGG